MIYFISGHLTTTEEEFAKHYIPVLERIFMTDPRHKFVVGDAKGTDRLTQAWLRDKAQVWNTTVYHMLSKPRFNLALFRTRGGYATDEARDAAMTAASDLDVAWVRPGREDSGTARNIARRAAMAKEKLPT